MGLVAGNRLGFYEIVSPLGAGGMGEVYRARDTRLDRTVALKVLNSSLTSRPDLKARFEREAKLISQLQHPNICVLHDIGSENGTDFLVMEYLEGESLADRLRKGPLPTEQLVTIAVQIADALDRAHRVGIIHRDLKPANVMLTKSGAKLLDFGLAKSTNVVSATSEVPAESVFRSALTQSPPQSPLSSAGAVIGTVRYMSPEQIAGGEADERSDIFAFGLLLYEMATGKHAFDAKTQSSMVGKILAVEAPSLTALQPTAPKQLDRLISLCLEKDPEERFQSIHDVKLQLQAISESAEPVSVQPSHSHKLLVGSMAVICAAALAIAGYFAFRTMQPRPVYRSALLAPEKTALLTEPALSPDGTRIAFVAVDEKGTQMLYVQPLDSGSARALAGSQGAALPFWSPDSQNIGFFADSELKRIQADGGPVQTLAPALDPQGGTWGPGGTIVFAPSSSGGLMQVSSDGGTPSMLTRPTGTASHRWPVFLPDGKHVVFTDAFRPPSPLEVADLATGAVKQLSISANHAAFANGCLLYVRQDRTLMAQPYSLSKLETTGEPIALAEHVIRDRGSRNYHIFSVSENGVLVYQSGSGTLGLSKLQWMDRKGNPIETLGDPERYTFPAISPDGKQVAVRIGGPDSAIWVLSRGTKTRLTFGAADENEPSWTPDG